MVASAGYAGIDSSASHIQLCITLSPTLNLSKFMADQVGLNSF